MNNLKNKNIFNNFDYLKSNLTIKNIISYFGKRIIDLSYKDTEKYEILLDEDVQNILLNNLGYNFKRIIMSKLFNFNYKLYTFENNKIPFHKKIILKLLRVEIKTRKEVDPMKINEIVESNLGVNFQGCS